MKTNLRHLLVCAALAGFVPLLTAASAENPPVENKTAAPATAPVDPTATRPAVAPEPAPATQPSSTSAPAAAPEAPAAEPAGTAPAAAMSEAAPSEPALRKLDAPTETTPEARESTTTSTEPTTDKAPAPKRRARKSSGGQAERVTIGGNASLGPDEVANTVVAIAGNAVSEGEVADSVVAVFGNVRVTGPVHGEVVAVLGNVYVNSEVGEVVAVLGTVELGPKAVVRGDVVPVGGTVKRDPGAVVHGDIPSVSIGMGMDAEWLQAYLTNCVYRLRLLAFAPGIAWAWYIAIGFLLFYVAIAALFGGAVTTCARTLETRPGGSIIAAILTVLLTPVLIVLLTITVVGLPVVPFLAVGIKLATLFGKAVMLAWLGRRITRLFGDGPLAHPAFAVLIGGLIVLGLYLVPVLSMIVYMMLGILGLGVVVYTLILANKKEKPTPPPVYAVPVVPAGVGPAAGFSSGGTAAVAVEPGVAAGTPPPVAVATLPRAGFWIRTGALLIDVLLVGVVAVAISSVLPRAMKIEGPGFLLVLAIYGAVLWKIKGTTIGGIICGLRLVRTDGREIDWPTAVVRSLGCFLSLVVAGLGFIWAAIDDEKQSWHDKIAGTTVVHSRVNSLV